MARPSRQPTAEELEILRKLNAAVDHQRRIAAVRSAIKESPQIQANIRALASISGQGCTASEVEEMLVSAIVAQGRDARTVREPNPDTRSGNRGGTLETSSRDRYR